MKRDQASSERDSLRHRAAPVASASDSPEPLRPFDRLRVDLSSAEGRGAQAPSTNAGGGAPARLNNSPEPLRGAQAPSNRAGGGAPARLNKRRAPRAVENVGPVMRALARAIDGLELPAVEKISEAQEENPFQVLIATLLSARTQDQTTLAASTRLFAVARTPRTMAKLTVKQIERLIYPVSFYRHKARHVKATCQILVDRFSGCVPTTMEALLTLPGVGRKTANLVLILAFKSLRNICVDTHVHRISNRLGWVRTRTPDETEQALYQATAARWWPYINLYLVTWGQNVCRPVYPRCGECAIRPYCPQIGVAPKRQRA